MAEKRKPGRPTYESQLAAKKYLPSIIIRLIRRGKLDKSLANLRDAINSRIEKIHLDD